MDTSEATKQMHDTQDAKFRRERAKEIQQLDAAWSAQVAALKAQLERKRNSRIDGGNRAEMRDKIDALEHRVEMAERDRARAAEVLPQVLDLRHKIKRAEDTNRHSEAERLTAELKALPPVPRPHMPR